MSRGAIAFPGGPCILGGINHEYGEFVLYRGIVRLLDISAIHVQGFPSTEERRIHAHSFS